MVLNCTVVSRLGRITRDIRRKIAGHRRQHGERKRCIS
jgi:hypothetical protein